MTLTLDDIRRRFLANSRCSPNAKNIWQSNTATLDDRTDEGEHSTNPQVEAAQKNQNAPVTLTCVLNGSPSHGAQPKADSPPYKDGKEIVHVVTAQVARQQMSECRPDHHQDESAENEGQCSKDNGILKW